VKREAEEDWGRRGTRMLWHRSNVGIAECKGHIARQRNLRAHR
jgi:hypothetical protein